MVIVGDKQDFIHVMNHGSTEQTVPFEACLPHITYKTSVCLDLIVYSGLCLNLAINIVNGFLYSYLYAVLILPN